jgi:hypothetical protein
MKWVSIKDKGYPSTKDNPYPVCLVVITTASGEYSKIEIASLRFIGSDNNRPYWCDRDIPIENSSWHVTHWMPLPNLPICKKESK